jgi:hypothetical protein
MFRTQDKKEVTMGLKFEMNARMRKQAITNAASFNIAKCALGTLSPFFAHRATSIDCPLPPAPVLPNHLRHHRIEMLFGSSRKW